ncbi:MAG TPA: MASE1 domain-containing protein [Vicinamibacterales bacterium]|nr:MASE1 domain-containing protein [Vicinamibacterales bacterium]
MRRIHLLALWLLVAGGYVAAALWGFRAAFLSEQVTTVWVPTGLAEAALLLGGLRLWPGVWVGAFAANAAQDGPLVASAAIAVGNTLEAVVAAWVLSRVVRLDPMFSRVTDAIWFLAIGAVCAPMVSATIGVAALVASGIEPSTRFTELWREWWLGDALGAVTIAPVILTVVRARHRMTEAEAWETGLWVALAAVLGAVVTGRGALLSFGDPSLVFLLFPTVIAAAVRLGQPATSLTVLTGSAVIVLAVMSQPASFDATAIHATLVRSQIFMSVLAASGLLLAAAVAERRRVDANRAAGYAVVSALSESSTVGDVAPRVLDAVSNTLRWLIGAFWIVDERAGRLRCIAIHEPAAVPTPNFSRMTREMQFDRGVGLPGRIWSTGRAAWIEDVADDLNFPRIAMARKEGLHGAFGFPILHHGEVLGVVEFFHRSVIAPDPDLLETAQAIGSQIGQFMARTRVETTAARSESQTRAMVETALDAIITMDHHGVITEFNGAAERMFGIPRGDAIGRELAALIIPPQLREGHARGLARYLETGEGPFIDKRIETAAVRADGHEFPAEVAITRVPTDPPLFTGFVRDLTERRQFEQERQALLDEAIAARREAETANRAKDVFLATLSHELRTPLNAITGWTRMLLDNAVEPANTRKALEIVDRNAQLQLQLVTDILDVSRIITGKLELDRADVDVRAVVTSALDAVRPAADAKQISLHAALPPEALVIPGDRKRLVQVMLNLLNNAIKFTPSGGDVRVTAAAGGASLVVLTVEDTGAGIDPAFLPHVFDRFRQADSSSTRVHGGLGLGLAIVRHLVELHHGAVRAESNGPGLGARFIVELPRTV